MADLLEIMIASNQANGHFFERQGGRFQLPAGTFQPGRFKNRNRRFADLLSPAALPRRPLSGRF